MKDIKFDKEYYTSDRLEVLWLKQNDIRYTFIKKDDITGETIWKYKKTKELALSLSRYWNF